MRQPLPDLHVMDGWGSPMQAWSRAHCQADAAAKSWPRWRQQGGVPQLPLPLEDRWQRQVSGPPPRPLPGIPKPCVHPAGQFASNGWWPPALPYRFRGSTGLWLDSFNSAGLGTAESSTLAASPRWLPWQHWTGQRRRRQPAGRCAC